MKRILFLILFLSLALSACGKSGMPSAAKSPEKAEPDKAVETPIELETEGGYAGLLACSDYGLMAVRADGRLYGWGDDILVQRAWRAYEDGSVRYIGAENVASVFCTRLSFLYIDTEGTLWGVNWPSWGYLQTPRIPMEQQVKLMEGVKMAALDEARAFALDENGILWTWGLDQGSAADAEAASEEQPRFNETPKKLMEGISFVEAREGAYYAISEDGGLWAWGNTGLADETGSRSWAEPRKILEGVEQVSGGRQSLAVKEDGSLWAWGGAELIGTNHNPFSYFQGGAPEKIMDGVSYAASGFGQWAAVKADGGLWVWGSNRNGALGDGTEDYRPEPFCVIEEKAEFVTCGNGNIYAVKEDGTLWELGTEQSRLFKLKSRGDQDALRESRLPHQLLGGMLRAD